MWPIVGFYFGKKNLVWGIRLHWALDQDYLDLIFYIWIVLLGIVLNSGFTGLNIILHLYIYIYNEWRNWNIKLENTMTRKSGTHLHATYEALNSCFDLIRSHQQCTPWSPPLEIEPTTTVCRSRNSTTRPLVHAIYKRCRITMTC